MVWLFHGLMSLFTAGVFLFLIWALCSPMETLGWWAGWSHRSDAPSTSVDTPIASQSADVARARDHFIVYLTAVGGISSLYLSTRERGFLQGLAARVPGSVIVHDVFPFSVTNNPLDGERFLAGLWLRLHLRRLRKRSSKLSFLIFLRNMLQVAVSADPRYGPIFNAGVAKQISDSLLRKGYPSDGNKRITLIAWSGGAQIAVGAAQYLNRAFQAPVQIFSLGGVFANDPGLAHIEHLYHLTGSRDNFFPGIGTILCPGRWPVLRNSCWNQARRQGRITIIVPGPMRHTGREDYYDGLTRLPDGQTYLDKTLDVVTAKIVDPGRSLPFSRPATR